MTLEMITTHTIVCNEDRFIKDALTSVLFRPEVTRALVWDAGSIDKTVSEILSVNDPRIEFRELGRVDRKQLVQFRSEQLQETKTAWFMLVDGDEIWPKHNLNKLVSVMKSITHSTSSTISHFPIALVNRTRNAVGDLFHYLPEEKGHYRIGPWTGHLNIRTIRNMKGLTVKGEYPNEWYELDEKKIQDYPDCTKVGPWRTPGSDLNKCVRFVDTWYLHATHLRRSSSLWAELTTTDRLKKRKWFSKLRGGVKVMKPDELPDVLRKGNNET